MPCFYIRQRIQFQDGLAYDLKTEKATARIATGRLN